METKKKKLEKNKSYRNKKNTVIGGKYLIDRLNKRLELVKERINEMKDGADVIFQNERKKNKNRKEEWKKIISSKIHTNGVLGVHRDHKCSS